MPLYLETRRSGAWVVACWIQPGDPNGSFSNNRSDGIREIYYLKCLPDDSKSIIYRLGYGVDLENPQGVREIFPDQDGVEVISELGPGESFEMMIRTDISPESRKIRLVHHRRIRP